MDAIIHIGLIIIGILATMIALIGLLFGITMIVVAPVLGKLVGIFFIVAMVIIIIGLWIIILD